MSVLLTSSQLTVAYIADLAFGDPMWLPHPVRLFGMVIAASENVIRRVATSACALWVAGIILTTSISLSVGVGTWLLLNWGGKYSPTAASLAVVYLAYTTLSVRALDQAGKQVIELLTAGKLDDARSALSAPFRFWAR